MKKSLKPTLWRTRAAVLALGAIVACGGGSDDPAESDGPAHAGEDWVDPGEVPASEVEAPTSIIQPLHIVEPPNPALHTPPMDNPNGVDGDRPARPEL